MAEIRRLRHVPRQGEVVRDELQLQSSRSFQRTLPFLVARREEWLRGLGNSRTSRIYVHMIEADGGDQAIHAEGMR